MSREIQPDAIRRPDIRAAEQGLIAANANIGVAKAAYFPQISLSGFLGGQSTRLANLFSGPNGAWSLVPQVTQPIFAGGRLKNGVRLAEAWTALGIFELVCTVGLIVPAAFHWQPALTGSVRLWTTPVPSPSPPGAQRASTRFTRGATAARTGPVPAASGC